MKYIKISELNEQTKKFVNLALKGEEIILTDNGSPVLELKPIQRSMSISNELPQMTRLEAFERIMYLRNTYGNIGVSPTKILREMRNGE